MFSITIPLIFYTRQDVRKLRISYPCRFFSLTTLSPAVAWYFIVGRFSPGRAKKRACPLGDKQLTNDQQTKVLKRRKVPYDSTTACNIIWHPSFVPVGLSIVLKERPNCACWRR